MEVAGLPLVLVRLAMPLLEDVEDILPAVALPGRVDLPEVLSDEGRELRPARPELGTMEQRLRALSSSRIPCSSGSVTSKGSASMAIFTNISANRSPSSHAFTPLRQRRSPSRRGIVLRTRQAMVTVRVCRSAPARSWDTPCPRRLARTAGRGAEPAPIRCHVTR
jgi:hypothetical protein